MYVRQTVFVFMLFVYLGHFLVFSPFLITYACSIIAVYRYGATLVNFIYLGLSAVVLPIVLKVEFKFEVILYITIYAF